MDENPRVPANLPAFVYHAGKAVPPISAVLWITRSGAQWRLLPEKYGHFDQLFAHLSADRDLEYLLIDSTIVRARACAACAPKKQARRR